MIEPTTPVTAEVQPSNSQEAPVYSDPADTSSSLGDLSPFHPAEGFGADGMPPVEDDGEQGPMNRESAAQPLGDMVGLVEIDHNM